MAEFILGDCVLVQVDGDSEKEQRNANMRTLLKGRLMKNDTFDSLPVSSEHILIVYDAASMIEEG